VTLTNQFTPKCPICDQPMEMMDGELAEPLSREMRGRKIYVCTRHNMRSPCYPGTLKPMGEPANNNLRRDRVYIKRQLEVLVERKTKASGLGKSAAEKAALAWVSAVIGREVQFVEEISHKEADLLIPVLRKF
jgi:hypothetical protein